MNERASTADRGTLIALFKQLMHAARPTEAGLALMHKLDLMLPQILSLAHLRRGPQTVSALAGELALTPGAVSRLIDQLVAKGLVRRAEGEDDRRCKCLTLSSTGRRALLELDGARDADLARMLRRLPDDVQEELEAVLAKVAVSVTAQPEEAP